MQRRQSGKREDEQLFDILQLIFYKYSIKSNNLLEDYKILLYNFVRSINLRIITK